MAKLYVKSPTGDTLSHEVTCSSFSVGGTSVDWNRHYFVLPNGYLIYTHTHTSPNSEFALPFSVWGISACITREAVDDDTTPTVSPHPLVYIYSRDSSLHFTIKTNYADGGTRWYNLLLIGEINTNG